MIRILVTAAVVSALWLIANYIVRGIGDTLETEAAREREMDAWR